MASNWLWQDRKEKIIILDTNAILMLFEFSIDLEDELMNLFGNFKILIPKNVINELEFLSKHGKGKKKIISRPALKLSKKYEIININEEIFSDDAVLDLAIKLNGIVLTNDRDLRRKLKERSLHSIFLRNKGYLVME